MEIFAILTPLKCFYLHPYLFDRKLFKKQHPGNPRMCGICRQIAQRYSISKWNMIEGINLDIIERKIGRMYAEFLISHAQLDSYPDICLAHDF